MSRRRPHRINFDKYVWARSVRKDTGERVVGKLLLDWESAYFGCIRIESTNSGGVRSIAILSPYQLETPTPLKKQEIFQYRLKGLIP